MSKRSSPPGRSPYQSSCPTRSVTKKRPCYTGKEDACDSPDEACERHEKPATITMKLAHTQITLGNVSKEKRNNDSASRKVSVLKSEITPDCKTMLHQEIAQK